MELIESKDRGNLLNKGNRLLQQVCDPDKKRGRRRKGNGNQRKCRRSNRH